MTSTSDARWILLKYIIKIKNFYSFNQLAALLEVLFEREKISLSINEKKVKMQTNEHKGEYLTTRLISCFIQTTLLRLLSTYAKTLACYNVYVIQARGTVIVI